jgi:hypothetical protein
MLVDLLRGRPYVSIGREVGTQALKRLPGQEYRAICGFVEICPEERRPVSRDLRCAHKPFGNLVQVKSRHRGVSKRRDKMDMGQLKASQKLHRDSIFL